MSTRTERAVIAHDRLVEAMVERTPNCDGIDAFTEDYLPRDEIAFLKPICAACDLQLLCRQYAELDKPKAGFWAGRYYGPRYRSSKAA